MICHVLFFAAGVVLGEAWAGVDDQSESRRLTLGKRRWGSFHAGMYDPAWDWLVGGVIMQDETVSLFSWKKLVPIQILVDARGSHPHFDTAKLKLLTYWKSCPGSPLVVGNRFYCCISATWKWNPREVTLLSQYTELITFHILPSWLPLAINLFYYPSNTVAITLNPVPTLVIPYSKKNIAKWGGTTFQ